MSSEAERFISYAQHGEDVVVWRAFAGRGPGFYVDVGAFDPTYDSVTRALYERGWHGINIEPQADRIAAFEEQRPRDVNLAIAIGDRDGTAVLDVTSTPGWARLRDVPGEVADGSVESVEVPIRRLESLFSEMGVDCVDLLKIDVEGAEPAVVRGLLGGSVRPTVCIVEGVAPATGRDAGDEAVALLVEAGYVHCFFDGLNHYLTTDVSLQPDLSVPANPLDGHTTDVLDRLLQDQSDPDDLVVRYQAENADLRVALADARSSLARARSSALERRQEMFARLIVDAPSVPWPTRSDAGTLGDRFDSMLVLAMGQHDPNEIVSVLYRVVLGRDPDPEGSAMWMEQLRDGVSPIAVGEALAGSPEMKTHSEARRREIHAELITWRMLSSAVEMGLVSGTTDMEISTDAIFVSALFEVALERPPSRGELDFEVGKLRSGTGRDWMVRAYVGRPDVEERFLGSRGAGMRSRMVRWRARRRLRSHFTTMVLAAEAARRAELRAAIRPARTACAVQAAVGKE